MVRKGKEQRSNSEAKVTHSRGPRRISRLFPLFITFTHSFWVDSNISNSISYASFFIPRPSSPSFKFLRKTCKSYE